MYGDEMKDDEMTSSALLKASSTLCNYLVEGYIPFNGKMALFVKIAIFTKRVVFPLKEMHPSTKELQKKRLIMLRKELLKLFSNFTIICKPQSRQRCTHSRQIARPAKPITNAKKMDA